jgi:hypothetical protein
MTQDADTARVVEDERARVFAAGALGGYWGMKVGDGLPLVEASLVIDAYLASLAESRRLRDYDPNEPHCPRCGINFNLLVDRDYLCIRCAQREAPHAD